MSGKAACGEVVDDVCCACVPAVTTRAGSDARRRIPPTRTRIGRLDVHARRDRKACVAECGCSSAAPLSPATGGTQLARHDCSPCPEGDERRGGGGRAFRRTLPQSHGRSNGGQRPAGVAGHGTRQRKRTSDDQLTTTPERPPPARRPSPARPAAAIALIPPLPQRASQDARAGRRRQHVRNAPSHFALLRHLGHGSRRAEVEDHLVLLVPKMAVDVRERELVVQDHGAVLRGPGQQLRLWSWSRS